MQTAESPSHPLNFFLCVCLKLSVTDSKTLRSLFPAEQTNKQAKPIQSSQTLKSNQQLVPDTKLRHKILKVLFWATHAHKHTHSVAGKCLRVMVICYHAVTDAHFSPVCSRCCISSVAVPWLRVKFFGRCKTTACCVCVRGSSDFIPSSPAFLPPYREESSACSLGVAARCFLNPTDACVLASLWHSHTSFLLCCTPTVPAWLTACVRACLGVSYILHQYPQPHLRRSFLFKSFHLIHPRVCFLVQLHPKVSDLHQESIQRRWLNYDLEAKSF